MADKLALTINIDGAARGNPGPAAYGIYLVQEGKPPLEIKEKLGHTTNNVAEYTALVHALHKAIEMGATEVLIRSDSELLVKQMGGQYRVKNENILPLYNEAVELRRQIPQVRIQHVYREQNRDADRLCNEALDGPTTPAAKPSRKKKEPAAPALFTEAPPPNLAWELVGSEIAELLQQAAASNATWGPMRAHQVAQAITKLLQERGFTPPAGTT
jgi:ribonuclease HI